MKPQTRAVAAMMSGAKIRYLLRDEFNTARAAGAVNSTLAEPGPGTRVVVDTDGDACSITGGRLTFANPNNVYGNPGFWLDGVSRIAGRLLKWEETISVGGNQRCGWDINQAGSASSDLIYISTSGPMYAVNTGVNPAIGAVSTSTSYQFIIILRSTGDYYFVKGGAYTDWTLLWTTSIDNDATLYPNFSSYSANFSCNFVRVPRELWLPTPLAYDTFGNVTITDQSGLFDLSTGDGVNGNNVALGLTTGPDGSSSAARFNIGDNFISVGSAGFAAKFNPDVGTMFAFGRINAASVWADTSTFRYTTHCKSAADATKYIAMGKHTDANTLFWRRRDSVNIKEVTAAYNVLTWFSQALTWSTSANETKAFLNGAQTGSTLTAAAMTVSDFNNNATLIGAGSPTLQEWQGDISNVIYGYGVVATPAQILSIHNGVEGGTLTTADLDTIFGSGNWSWWKLDETWNTQTTGPDSQSTPARTWQSGGATWTISTNEAINVPTEGSDVIVNGGFGADSDWDKGAGWSIAAGVATKAAGSATDLSQTVAPLTAGTWYKLVHTTTRSAGSITPKFGTQTGVARSTSNTFTETQRANGTAFALSADASFAGTEDNVAVTPLTLNTLFSALETSTADVLIRLELDTIAAGTQAGMVINLDSVSAPANFVIAYHDGTNARLEKCVAGTYTSVISAIAAYAAGANLVVVKDGTSYSLYYNTAQVGATSTISDAGVISNTLHGMFSTYSGNQLDNLQVFPRGTNGEYARLDRF